MSAILLSRSAHVEYFKALPQNFFKVEGGMYDYGGLSSAYRESSAWAICFTAEKSITMTAHGRIRMPLTTQRLLTYSQGDDASGGSITVRGYHGKWHSSDQIPVERRALVGFLAR